MIKNDVRTTIRNDVLTTTDISITENEFQTMGQVSEGYSGSDISVVVSTSFLIVVRTSYFII